jgi:hypothetical protein
MGTLGKERKKERKKNQNTNEGLKRSKVEELRKTLIGVLVTWK